MPRSLASDGGSIALESVTTTTRCPMAQTLPSDTIGNGRNRDARHAGVRVLRTRIGYEVRVRVVDAELPGLILVVAMTTILLALVLFFS